MQLARFQHRVTGDPASARTTFRAAVADIPGSRELWLAFLEFEAGQPQVSLALCLDQSRCYKYIMIIVFTYRGRSTCDKALPPEHTDGVPLNLTHTVTLFQQPKLTAEARWLVPLSLSHLLMMRATTPNATSADPT